MKMPKLGLHTTLMTIENILVKIFLTLPGGFVPKIPLWRKNGLLSLYRPNAAINVHSFWYGDYPCSIYYLRKLWCICWENSRSPFWWLFLPPKNVKNPPYDSAFLKVDRFCQEFALWVIWCCWVHFYVILTQEGVVTPWAIF